MTRRIKINKEQTRAAEKSKKKVKIRNKRT